MGSRRRLLVMGKGGRSGVGLWFVRLFGGSGVGFGLIGKVASKPIFIASRTPRLIRWATKVDWLCRGRM